MRLWISRSYGAAKPTREPAGSGSLSLYAGLIDGALQTVAGLVGSVEPGAPKLPFALDEVEIIRPLPQSCYAYVELADSEDDAPADVRKLNIQMLNERGEILVRLKNLHVRAAGRMQPGVLDVADQGTRRPRDTL